MRPAARTPEQERLLQESLAHLDGLYRVALRMTRDPRDAEDLVQETYLRAVRAIASYREGAGLRPWLFRILTNAYIDRYRREARAPETVELTDDPGLYRLFLAERAEGGGSAVPWKEEELEAFLKRFVGDEVKAALEALPPSFRLVVLLREVEGLSYGEIAAITGVPAGTVMSRLFRGRRALEQGLGEYARARGYGPRGELPAAEA